MVAAIVQHDVFDVDDGRVTAEETIHRCAGIVTDPERHAAGRQDVAHGAQDRVRIEQMIEHLEAADDREAAGWKHSGFEDTLD